MLICTALTREFLRTLSENLARSTKTTELLQVNVEYFFIMKPHHSKRTEKPSTVPILTLALRQACSSRGKTEKGRLPRACVDVFVCEKGQTFPWQDPRDPAEGRVQPLKERMRARQSISSSHLHNKWSSHGFSSPHTHVCTHHSWVYPLSAHQRTPTQGHRE